MRKWLSPKRLLLILILAAVAALIVMSLAPKPVAVDTAAVTRGPMQVTIDEEGETRVRERFDISAPLTGRITRIELEPGDVVTRGETILVTMQPSAPVLLDARARAEAEARIKASEAALGLARADRDRAAAEKRFADSELTRIRNLAQREILSVEALDNAELQAETAAERLRVAEFAIRNAEYDVSLARAAVLQDGETAAPVAIIAPIDGVVLKRHRESEALVQSGELLLEIGDPSDLEIVADLLSTDAVNVTAGDEVLIERWGGDGALRGEVRRVEPSGFTKISALGVEEQRVNIIIDPNEDQRWRALGDAYRVEVRIVVWSETDVVQVPTSALMRLDDGWAVFRYAAETAALQTVDVGHMNGLAAQVLTGLEAQDVVIIHPSDAVADGAAVAPRD